MATKSTRNIDAALKEFREYANKHQLFASTGMTHKSQIKATLKEKGRTGSIWFAVNDDYQEAITRVMEMHQEYLDKKYRDIFPVYGMPCCGDEHSMVFGCPNEGKGYDEGLSFPSLREDLRNQRSCDCSMGGFGCPECKG